MASGFRPPFIALPLPELCDSLPLLLPLSLVLSLLLSLLLLPSSELVPAEEEVLVCPRAWCSC